MTKTLNYKTRLAIINGELDFIESFKKLVPELKKKGSNYVAKSPFQDEKTPSFSVNARKHCWHCFSTNQGGKSIVSFVAKRNNLTFMQALELVETRFGLNKKTRNAKTMMSIIEVLKEKPIRNTEESHGRMSNIYHESVLKLVKNFKKSANDKWKILDPIIDYIWEEYDATEMHTHRELREFLQWAYKLLRYFKNTTIANLHTI